MFRLLLLSLILVNTGIAQIPSEKTNLKNHSPEITYEHKYRIIKAIAELKLMQEQLDQAKKNLEEAQQNLKTIVTSIQTSDCGDKFSINYTLTLNSADPSCTTK